ncbi:unnamed protein product [Fraxinus pennsylvanica]|uniref:Photosystem II 10 kDa polypeptide, chloroplastic n=1 Tax=Fraxinus pennsylvanica TaxID=56036 RepID=A0AAD2AGZ7_9LAMI|nr:unnamed protein product [Fraxinus pennsylvanica]
MATTVMTSLNLKPSPLTLERTAVHGLLSLARTSSLRVEASGGKKIKTDKPYGINGGIALRDDLDASGRKPKVGLKPYIPLERVYQFVDLYGANVDGYSPIYNTDDWSPSGTTGLAIWAVTLVGILAGGALLLYKTSVLYQSTKYCPSYVKIKSLPLDSLPGRHLSSQQNLSSYLFDGNTLMVKHRIWQQACKNMPKFPCRLSEISE